MRLDEGAIRELHWHKEGEWAYILEGKVPVTALDREGGKGQKKPVKPKL
jgi:oxalate decarboxylase/phosphoglucose isomerase-like protein (cupin superfamily)